MSAARPRPGFPAAVSSQTATATAPRTGVGPLLREWRRRLSAIDSGLVFTALASGDLLASVGAEALAPRFGRQVPAAREVRVACTWRHGPAPRGAASGVLSTARQVGNTIGVAAIGAIFYGATGRAGPRVLSSSLWSRWRRSACRSRLSSSCCRGAPRRRRLRCEPSPDSTKRGGDEMIAAVS